MEFLYNQETMIFASLVFGIIVYYSWTSKQERKWIEKRFQKKDILLLSFGVKSFGLSSEPGPPAISNGFLSLLSDQLIYRSRFKGIEIYIPTTSIIKVYHTSIYKKVDIHQSVVEVIFSNSESQEDSVAFKVPYPPQWIEAIQNCAKIKL